MSLGPLVGIVFALFAILVGNALEGGHMGSIVGGPAALIVIGGTIGATIVQFSPELSRERSICALLRKWGTSASRAEATDAMTSHESRASSAALMTFSPWRTSCSLPASNGVVTP